jgi:hypothetical protein
MLIDRHVLLSPSVQLWHVLLVVCGLSYLGVYDLRSPARSPTIRRRISTGRGHIRRRGGLTAPPGPSSGHSSRTKSVIRPSVIFPPEMVTGGFYARVTVRTVTPARKPAKRTRDKRPACKWLRSSRHNSADQSTTVIKSLCKNFASTSVRDCPVQTRQVDEICLLNGGSQHQKFAGRTYYSVSFSPTGRTAASGRG